ncbi:hypothetical protein [Paraburkholderia sp. SIMBA_054]|uniref:DUF7940 domain-containing protein n=1 Tax=Paraburkholderia sp. SIMBA_054 TaxID=3085795 RepID=UPI00397B7615
MAGTKLTLVENWKDAHTWASMWWSGVGLVASSADLLNDIWTSLDQPMQSRVPYAPIVGVVLFAATMIGRVLVWSHDKVEGTTDADHP